MTFTLRRSTQKCVIPSFLGIGRHPRRLQRTNHAQFQHFINLIIQYLPGHQRLSSHSLLNRPSGSYVNRITHNSFPTPLETRHEPLRSSRHTGMSGLGTRTSPIGGHSSFKHCLNIGICLCPTLSRNLAKSVVAP